MLAFENYLRNNNYTESSILSYSNTINRFLKWLYKEVIEIHEVEYGDVINYIKT